MSNIGEGPILYDLALSFVPGIGPVSARQLIRHLGSSEAIFRQKRLQLERIPGIGPERAAAIIATGVLKRAEAELKFMERHGVSAYFFMNEDYPRRLRQCEDAPIVLYSKGTVPLQSDMALSIVGTRRMTSSGKEFLTSFLERLAPLSVSVFSGLAYGVDIHAHKECLRVGMPTVAVTAHGMDHLYPSSHATIARRMCDNGGIITEYPSGTAPERDNFPARNRIVAGVSDATLVVESALRGGAMITAEFANGYNRDVFAVPGRTTDTYSKGCNFLIRSNKAMLVESAEDVVLAMNWQSSCETKPKQLPLFSDLTADKSVLVERMGDKCVHLDEIAFETGLPVSRVSVQLLELEFKGIVQPLPGKMFRIMR